MIIYILHCFLFFLLFSISLLFFFFNDTATTEIYTLSLLDALPILRILDGERFPFSGAAVLVFRRHRVSQDRKSTRLNSSHDHISYAVFCMKKKKKTYIYCYFTKKKKKKKKTKTKHKYR